jgi:hypothetical protein
MPQGEPYTYKCSIYLSREEYLSRVDYGRRAASQPLVSRSLSPNRTYTFCYVSGSPKTTAYLSFTAEHVSLHAGDRTNRSLLCVHRVFLRHQNTSVSCPPSPRGRLSRPQTTMRAPPRIRPSPVSTDSLCCHRQTRYGSHVPVLNLFGWLGACFTPGGPGEQGQEGVACSQVRFSRTFQMGP